MKRTLAALITAALLAGALLLGRRSPPASAPPPATPQDRIRQMFEAARAGDVDAYLDCFTGPQRTRIQRKLAGQSREAFAQSLADAVRDLKGHVTPQSAPQGDADRVELAVERIYQNRNERQSYSLVRQSGVWRISDVQAAVSFQPPVAYGAPVFEPPPEGAATQPSAKPD